MDWQAETPRLARLARLALSAEQARRLGAECAAIAEEFAALEAYAEGLPAAEEPPPGAARADDPAQASREEVEAILLAAPRVDPATGAIVAPRGSK